MPDKTQHPDEALVLKFTPPNDGDFLRGVPQRDLTVADMRFIEPVQLRDMTVPGPSGKPIYTYADPELAKHQEVPKESPTEDQPLPAANKEEKTGKSANAGTGKGAN